MDKRRRFWGYRISIIILALLLFGSWITNVGLFVALFGLDADLDDRPVDLDPYFKETWSSGYGTTKVVKLDLSGLIIRNQETSFFGMEQDPVETIIKQIQCAKMDADVKGILLCIDSPGGGVTASDQIYNALKTFRKSRDDRRILVHIRDIGASGAYYVAMAADYIMAEPTSVIGSIGVIMQNLNLKQLSDKIGIDAITIKSGKNKDLLNPFESVDTNQVAILQEVVNSLQNRFSNLVINNRDINSEDVVDGRVFISDDALKEGLIDSIGYFEDATKKLSILLQDEDLYIIRYDQKNSFWGSVLESKLPVFSGIQPFISPRFLYLWRP